MFCILHWSSPKPNWIRLKDKENINKTSYCKSLIMFIHLTIIQPTIPTCHKKVAKLFLGKFMVYYYIKSETFIQTARST